MPESRGLSDRRRLEELFMTKSLLTLSGAIFIGTFLLSSSAEAQRTDMADVESIGSIITATYDVISGSAGEERDWDRFRELFTEGATLSYVTRDEDGTYSRTIRTPSSYIESSGAALERDGFFEKEIHQVVESYGMIAHVFSTYESRRRESDTAPFARGINSFQLMNDGNRWWVVSIYWQSEGAENPIPSRYLSR
jgi:hypothetical protein